MPDYIVHPIEVDEEVLLEEVLEAIQLEFPNWTPHEGNFEVVLLRIITRMAAEGRTVASGVLKGVFRYWGTVIGVFPEPARAANATATLTLIDDSGWTIPQGTTFSLQDANGVPHYFLTDDEYIAPSGDSEIIVTLVARDPGAAASGLSGAISVVTSVDGIASAALTVGPSTGGADAETDDEYLQRVSRRLRLMKAAPVLAADYALAVLDVPGVFRSAVRDNFEPPSDDAAQDVITMSNVDEFGEWVGATVDGDVIEYLEAMREQNFNIYCVAPDYTPIKISYTATALPGWDPAAVEAAADANAALAVSPAVFGVEPLGEARTWTLTGNAKVYYHEVSQAINETPGLDKLLTLQIAAEGDALGTADVDLDGWFPLPRPSDGNVGGTVS